MVTVEELEALLAGDHELRGLELKGAGLVRRNTFFVAKVARAVMAMGNLRDGGLVVVGIDDDQIAAMQPGLSDDEFAEWSDFDLVAGALSAYSDPPVTFELRRFTLSNGSRVVVIDVDEFEHDVHICKKDAQGVLQGGQTYVRPRGKPESVPVPSSAAARELHNLAVSKGIREFVRIAGAAGVSLGPAAPDATAVAAADAQAYDAERQEAWSAPNPVNEPAAGAVGSWVSTPGYTDVVVRPSRFVADRLNPAHLDGFVVEHAVSKRGWPVPFVGREPIGRHGQWVAQDIPPAGLPHGEAWRMFTSGQFLHRRLLATDLRDAQPLKPTLAGASGAVAVWDVLLYMVEVAEFGARMATTLSLDEVTFEVGLEGIANRQVVSGDFARHYEGRSVASVNRFETAETVDVATLLDDPAAVGVKLTQQLLQQFGVQIPAAVLYEWQDEVFNRRR